MLMRLTILTLLMLCAAQASLAGVEQRQFAGASGVQGLDAAQLAARDMAVGRWYLDRHDYVAAINRFRWIVTDYQSSPDVEEALERLVECYLNVRIQTSQVQSTWVNSEAQTAVAVLIRKFPDGRWSSAAHALLRAKGLEPVETQGSYLLRSFK
jgi:outer membrane protein assembly factor BamD